MPKKLPDLPGSDESTLKTNRMDSFYEKKPSDIWKGYVENIKLKGRKKCSHKFRHIQRGIECEKCHIGFVGEGLRIKNGHIFFGNQRFL